MKQLVQLKESTKAIADQDAEVIVVFREEKGGVRALQTIKNRQKVDFTLALDLNKKQTGNYSPKKMTFDNYVVDKSGKIRGIFDGKLRTRAQAKQILSVLKDINDAK